MSDAMLWVWGSFVSLGFGSEGISKGTFLILSNVYSFNKSTVTSLRTALLNILSTTGLIYKMLESLLFRTDTPRCVSLIHS